jgi:hypothetical protein
MSKQTAIVSIVAFLVGAVAGGWSVAAFYGRFTNRLTVVSLTAECGTTVHTLSLLRSGDTTNAVESLELKLDGDLIGLGGFLTPDQLKRDPTVKQILQMTRDYRGKYPRQSDSGEVAQGVARAFTLLNEESHH